MKKLLTILTLTFVLALSPLAFVGCGCSNDSIYGTYSFYSLRIVKDGVVLSAEETESYEGYGFYSNVSLKLKKDGTCVLSATNPETSEIDLENGTFELDGTTLKIFDTDGQEIEDLGSITLKNGRISFYMEGTAEEEENGEQFDYSITLVMKK